MLLYCVVSRRCRRHPCLFSSYAAEPRVEDVRKVAGAWMSERTGDVRSAPEVQGERPCRPTWGVVDLGRVSSPGSANRLAPRAQGSSLATTGRPLTSYPHPKPDLQHRIPHHLPRTTSAAPAASVSTSAM